MEQYSINCTPEQTRKALVLGAPIENHNYTFGDIETLVYLGKDYTKLPALDLFAQQPTAEQMKGWLRTKGFAFGFSEYNDHFNDHVFWRVATEGRNWYKSSEKCKDIKEATLAAIDAALKEVEHLDFCKWKKENNKE